MMFIALTGSRACVSLCILKTIRIYDERHRFIPTSDTYIVRPLYPPRFSLHSQGDLRAAQVRCQLAHPPTPMLGHLNPAASAGYHTVLGHNAAACVHVAGRWQKTLAGLRPPPSSHAPKFLPRQG